MRSYNVILLFSLGFLLSACVHVEETYLRDGSQGYRLDCGGYYLGYGDCLKKAGDICGAQGYSIVDSDGAAIPYTEMSAYSNRHGSGMSASSGSMITRDVFIRCKGKNPQ